MIEDKSAISLAKWFVISVLAGIAMVLVLLAWGLLSHKDFSVLSQETLTIYLVQGTIFLLAALWTGLMLGINFKATLSNYNANIKNDLKLALKYYLVYALSMAVIIGVIVLIAICLMKMGLFDMAAYNKAHVASSLRQPEMKYLRDIVIGSPFMFILYLFAACILNPIGEEIFFRRFLYVSLRHMMSFLPSLFISSLIFGAEHWGGGVVVSFIIGLFLGWIYEKHQNLPVNIIVHGLINFSVTLVMIFFAIK